MEGLGKIVRKFAFGLAVAVGGFSCGNGTAVNPDVHRPTKDARVDSPRPADGGVDTKARDLSRNDSKGDIGYDIGADRGIDLKVDSRVADLPVWDGGCVGYVPLNSLQKGVCKGSKKICKGGRWVDNYKSVVGFEFPELSCDGKDNDCDGKVDENVIINWYPDKDGDSWGDASAKPLKKCKKPAGNYVKDNNKDCDDTRKNVNPLKKEVTGNCLDDNCNKTADEGSPYKCPANPAAVVVDTATSYIVPCGRIDTAGVKTTKTATIDGCVKVKKYVSTDPTSGQFKLTATTITVSSSGRIIGNGAGFIVGAGTGRKDRRSGGSYGARGSFGGSTYGTTCGVDIAPGSGGRCSRGRTGAGIGGGMVYLIGNSITMDGHVELNGSESSNNSCGSGSGGGFLAVASKNLQLTGQIDVKGGTRGSAGGGGRIKGLYAAGATYKDSLSFNLGSRPGTKCFQKK